MVPTVVSGSGALAVEDNPQGVQLTQQTCGFGLVAGRPTFAGVDRAIVRRNCGGFRFCGVSLARLRCISRAATQLFRWAATRIPAYGWNHLYGEGKEASSGAI